MSDMYEISERHSRRFLGYEREVGNKEAYRFNLSTLDEYAQAFDALHPEIDILHAADLASEEQRAVAIFEPMGSGGIFYQNNAALNLVNSEGKSVEVQGISVTLTDRRRKLPELPNVQVICGNLAGGSLNDPLLNPDPWNTISQWVIEHGLVGFDLIFLKPEDKGFRSLGFFEGFDDINRLRGEWYDVAFTRSKNQASEVYFSMINKAYELLAVNGVLFFEWPNGVNETAMIYSWAEAFNLQTETNEWDTLSVFQKLIHFTSRQTSRAVTYSQENAQNHLYFRIEKNIYCPTSLGSSPF